MPRNMAVEPAPPLLRSSAEHKEFSQVCIRGFFVSDFVLATRYGPAACGL